MHHSKSMTVCPICDGNGYTYEDVYDEYHVNWTDVVDCANCGATGEVECDPETDWLD